MIHTIIILSKVLKDEFPDCPQFVPADKIPKRKDGKNRYANFTNGKLVKNKNNAHIFVSADGPQVFEMESCKLNDYMKLTVQDVAEKKIARN